MSPTVLVTGASGRLGRPLVDELARRGVRTRALVRRRRVANATEIVRGDLEHPETLDGIAAGVDVVVHLAAVTHARRESRYRAGNVVATRNLLDALRRDGAPHVVHVGTRAIDPSGGAYSRAKLEAERLVRASGLPFTILRLAEVYGLGGEGVDAVIAQARRGRVVLPGAGEVCPVHVDDAVAAIANAVERRPEGATYTLAGDCLSLHELARLAGAGRIVTAPGAVVRVLSAAARVLPLPLYPDQLVRLRSPKDAASPEAADALGFRPRPLEQGLRT